MYWPSSEAGGEAFWELCAACSRAWCFSLRSRDLALTGITSKILFTRNHWDRRHRHHSREFEKGGSLVKNGACMKVIRLIGTKKCKNPTETGDKPLIQWGYCGWRMLCCDKNYALR
jgi:hypothetical protein